MSGQDQRDKRRPLLQATSARAEPPLAISLDALQRLIETQSSQANSRFSSMVEDKLQSFKRELSEDNASLLESVKKKCWNPSVKLRRVSPPISLRKLQRRSLIKNRKKSNETYKIGR